MDDDRKVILTSSDGRSFELSAKVAKLSQLVNEMIESDDDDGEALTIPLLNVNSDILQQVVSFCEHYHVEKMNEIKIPLKSKVEDTVQQWYVDFMKVDNKRLFDLVTAANYMNIKPLLDLTCYIVSVMINGQSEEEIRRIFNISNDLSPEEEEQVRQENEWCEQPPPSKTK